MNSVDVGQELKELKLKPPELACLYPDSKLYSVLLMQPTGAIEATDVRIGLIPDDQILAQQNTFLQLAQEQGADLVVAPEYCLMWQVLETAFTANTLPPPGCLWALGCESITVNELQEFQARHEQVVWIDEDIPATASGKYVDPICYVFQTQHDDSDEYRPVVIVQFKGAPMADSKYNFERDRLVFGQTMYVFNRDREDRVRLATLVCSDSMDYTANALFEERETGAYLILHLQLCTDPRHADFKNYRWLDLQRKRPNREYLSVNWARGFTILARWKEGDVLRQFDTPPSTFGYSSLFMKSHEVSTSDTHVEMNHRRGLYYTFESNSKVHVFTLNFECGAYLFRTTKALQTKGAGSSMQRTGPQMEQVYDWCDSQSGWKVTTEEPECDDGFAQLCKSAAADASIIASMASEVVNCERLIALSTACVSGSIGELCKATSLKPFLINKDEISKRIVATYDPDQDSMLHRWNQLRRFVTLESTLLADEHYLPRALRDISSNWTISYPIPRTDFDCNIADSSGVTASAAYVGECNLQHAEHARDRLGNTVHKDRQHNVFLWYMDTMGNYACLPYREAPRFSGDLRPRNSFIGGG